MNTNSITLGTYDQLALASYACAVLALGYWLKKRKKISDDSAESYFLDGRALSLPIFVATLVSTWYGGILGVGEFGFRYGISQWFMLGAPYYIFALIFAWLLVPIIRKSRSISLVDHCHETLGTTGGSLVALAVFVLTSPAPYLWMLVALLQLFLPLPTPVLLIGVILFASCYLISGRFFTIWSSNTLDFVLMFAGFLIIVPFCFLKYGGISFLSASLPDSHFSLTGGMNLAHIAIWWLMGAWTLVDPGFHQRVRAAQSESVARFGIMVAILAWMLFDFLTVSTALYARALLPDLSNAAHSYPLLGATILPDGLFGLFMVSLVATVLSTFNSFTFMAAQTLGYDFIGRIYPVRKDRLHKICIVLTLLVAGALVLAVPSAVDMWYLLAQTFLPPLLFALTASLGFIPKTLVKHSASFICALFLCSLAYQTL